MIFLIFENCHLNNPSYTEVKLRFKNITVNPSTQNLTQ